MRIAGFVAGGCGEFRRHIPGEGFAAGFEGCFGSVASWLQGFDYPAEDFAYTLSSPHAEKDISVRWVEFASPFKSPFPENNVVPGELYLPARLMAKCRA